MKPFNTVGIIGAGKVGTAIARRAVAAGYDTAIASSKPREEIELLTQIMVPGATPKNVEEAVDADLVVIAIPLPKYQQLDPSLFAGKIILDVMNYWAPTDGVIEEFEGKVSTRVIAEHFSGSTVVRALNHIGYHDIDEKAHTGRGAAVASDDENARQTVMQFISTLGFDPVDAGPLDNADKFANGTDIFNGEHTAIEIQELLNKV